MNEFKNCKINNKTNRNSGGGRSKHRLSGKTIRILLLALVIVAAAGGISLFAKYYAAKYNKGIAVASNLYFSSDKLKNNAGITDIDELVDDKTLIKSLNVVQNEGSWSSGYTTIPFHIQNFENSISYNDSNLDIKYRVAFRLLDEPKGADYYAVGTDNKEKEIKVDETVYMDGELEGGSVNEDSYGVKVSLTDKAENYTAARVLVMAYPVSPDYVYKKEDETQEYRILGIFEGKTTEAQISISDSGFKVADTSVNTDYETNWKNDISDLTGFIYNFKTKGDVVDSSTATKQEAKITWDTRYLEIDEQDDNYQYGLKQDKESKNSYYVTTEDNKKSLIIKVLPYTSINVTFYRVTGTDGFDTEFENQGENGKSWFESLVSVEIVKKSGS